MLWPLADVSCRKTDRESRDMLESNYIIEVLRAPMYALLLQPSSKSQLSKRTFCSVVNRKSYTGHTSEAYVFWSRKTNQAL